MLKCTVNGIIVEVEEGSTIIQAFKKAGLAIAHYCWHSALSVAGVCRLCTVEVEGMAALQLACNTQVRDGMVITNQSENVKKAVQWNLQFHLINHPLDCPICDQSGECELQEQYMHFGKYDPHMREAKVKKRKVVDLGSKIVLDSERCILCTRCVRFTNEVSKTNEFGVFNRGDRSEIGTFGDQPVENNYALNTVDICPVGALTAKDFRFRQRVWFLKAKPSICPSCSTGCNVEVFFNNKGVFRLKPRYNAKVNGHWMCDIGRFSYQIVNEEERLTEAHRHKKSSDWTMCSSHKAADEVADLLQVRAAEDPDSVALVLTAQYSCEEYDSTIANFVRKFGRQNVYWWNNDHGAEAFDGLLLRGDRNPNTKGLAQALAKHKIASVWSELEERIKLNKIKAVIVAGPENASSFSDLKDKIALLARLPLVVWLTAGSHESLHDFKYDAYLIPAATFLEKSGTFINYQGMAQTFAKVLSIVPQALTLSEAMSAFMGVPREPRVESKETPYVENEMMVKNEFVFARGPL